MLQKNIQNGRNLLSSSNDIGKVFESVAFLIAHLVQKIDDTFSEITQALLGDV